jgi:hypothetical protein
LNKKSSESGFRFTVQAIVLAAIAWAVLSLLFFLLFSVPLPGQTRPEWYGVTTYILENTAFLVAGLLCLRNWRSPQIVSGRVVWLAISLGMFSYFIGNLFLAYWEIGLGESPDISPGDFFFIATYLFLGWGMIQAVVSRRLNLSWLQWLVVAGILIAGLALAYFFNIAPGLEETALDSTALASATIAPPEAPAVDKPAWAIAVNNTLAPFADILPWLYIAGDLILVMAATTLLLAFWGGRFSLSWRFIAAAAFSFYIADTWFNYATSYIDNYETGALPEVFWIFSACLFAIGAALEYDLSTRSRRTSRRRQTQ